MFGFPMPDLGEMVIQINDFKAKFERLVCAVEENNRKLDLLLSHHKIEAPTTDVVDAEFSEDE